MTAPLRRQVGYALPGRLSRDARVDREERLVSFSHAPHGGLVTPTRCSSSGVPLQTRSNCRIASAAEVGWQINARASRFRSHRARRAIPQTGAGDQLGHRFAHVRRLEIGVHTSHVNHARSSRCLNHFTDRARSHAQAAQGGNANGVPNRHARTGIDPDATSRTSGRYERRGRKDNGRSRGGDSVKENRRQEGQRIASRRQPSMPYRLSL